MARPPGLRAAGAAAPRPAAAAGGPGPCSPGLGPGPRLRPGPGRHRRRTHRLANPALAARTRATKPCSTCACCPSTSPRCWPLAARLWLDGRPARWVAAPAGKWRAGRLDGDHLLIERLGGDLRVQDDAGPLPLGLSDLSRQPPRRRLALCPRRGRPAARQLRRHPKPHSPGPGPMPTACSTACCKPRWTACRAGAAAPPAGAWGRINGLARLSGRLGAPPGRARSKVRASRAPHALQGGMWAMAASRS